MNADALETLLRIERFADHPLGHPIRTAQNEFNLAYCNMLQLLEQAFNGNPAMRDQAVGRMYALRAKSQTLMKMPDGDNHVAGRTFQYVPRELLPPERHV